jgi:hypothetical protein
VASSDPVKTPSESQKDQDDTDDADDPANEALLDVETENSDTKEALEEEEEDAVIEDTSDIGETDDDMSEVREHVDEGVEDSK